MTTMQLGALLPYQQSKVYEWLGARNIEAVIEASGSLTTTNGNMSAQQQSGLTAALAGLKAAADPAAVKAAAESSIRGYWDQPLGGMTTTQVQAILVQANRNLATTFFNADITQIANYRTIINSTLTILAGLPPQFVTEFTKERTALGLGTDAAGATLAACQQWHLLLRGWLAGATLWLMAAKQAGVSD